MLINNVEKLIKRDRILASDLKARFISRVQISKPLDDLLEDKREGGEVGRLDPQLEVVLRNEDRDRNLAVIGKSKLLFILANLPNIQALNSILKKRYN